MTTRSLPRTYPAEPADFAPLLPAARALAPELPAWAWDLAARSHPYQEAPLDVAAVVELARWVAANLTPEGRPGPALEARAREQERRLDAAIARDRTRGSRRRRR